MNANVECMCERSRFGLRRSAEVFGEYANVFDEVIQIHADSLRQNSGRLIFLRENILINILVCVCVCGALSHRRVDLWQMAFYPMKIDFSFKSTRRAKKKAQQQRRTKSKIYLISLSLKFLSDIIIYAKRWKRQPPKSVSADKLARTQLTDWSECAVLLRQWATRHCAEHPIFV